MTYLNRIWQPRYSSQDCLPSVLDVKKAKTEYLKLEFSKVNETNEWYGKWYVAKKDITRLKKFNNNGLECYVVPLRLLRRYQVASPCIHEY
jgi:hypothetical protein